MDSDHDPLQDEDPPRKQGSPPADPVPPRRSASSGVDGCVVAFFMVMLVVAFLVLAVFSGAVLPGRDPGDDEGLGDRTAVRIDTRRAS